MASKIVSAEKKSNVIIRRGVLQTLAVVLLLLIGLFWLGEKTNWIALKQIHPAIFGPVVILEVGLFFIFRFGRRKRRRHV
jgi:hypothetical protein